MDVKGSLVAPHHQLKLCPRPRLQIYVGFIYSRTLLPKPVRRIVRERCILSRMIPQQLITRAAVCRAKVNIFEAYGVRIYSESNPHKTSCLRRGAGCKHARNGDLNHAVFEIEVLYDCDLVPVSRSVPVSAFGTTARRQMNRPLAAVLDDFSICVKQCESVKVQSYRTRCGLLSIPGRVTWNGYVGRRERWLFVARTTIRPSRSEERRVGKEC